MIKVQIPAIRIYEKYQDPPPSKFAEVCCNSFIKCEAIFGNGGNYIEYSFGTEEDALLFRLRWSE